MSSNFGIYHANKRQLNEYAAGRISRIESVSYGTADGMGAAECDGGNQNAGLKLKDGTLLFACVNGVVAVRPGSLNVNHLPPPVVIEQVFVNGKSTVNDAQLAVGRGELQFHFAGLSYSAPERVTFRYKLEGFDTAWVEAGTRRDAYYTNIPAGHYRFHVIAANNEGIWNRDGATFDLSLEPPFYQTWWFDIIAGFLAIACGWAGYVLRIRHLRKREEELVELVAERTAELREEIAGHRRTEDELQQEIIERQRESERAETATRAKSEFLANMSHEIRTPLNGVMGMLELVGDSGLNRDQAELVATAQHSAGALLAIIKDVLDFSKIEAGKLEIECVDFDLTQTVREACRTIAISAHQKGLELAFHVDPRVPAQLGGDPARLKQVFINLLGNAIKFTESGEVTLRVDVVSENRDGVQLHFAVKDTGIGVPHEKQQAIFLAFSQADTSITRRFGGTGLGLTICSRIISLMGGRIWLESEPGKGSTFSFAATLKRGKAEGTTRAAASFEGVRAMVVDDNETNRHILRDVLVQRGAIVTCAGEAEDALKEIADARKRQMPFQVLLTDVRMPGIDGFQFVEMLKASAMEDCCTVAMLELEGYSDMAARCRDAGIASYLMKPICGSELVECVRTALNLQRRSHTGATATESNGATQPRLKVLLAEDNPINQKVAVRMLESIGHFVTVARTGEEAVRKVQAEAFDFVFMDVNMPEMDGFAATAAIRQWERRQGCHLPIVAMTASAMSGDRERCLAAGMDGYVAKPITRQTLLEIIEKFAAVPVSA